MRFDKLLSKLFLKKKCNTPLRSTPIYVIYLMKFLRREIGVLHQAQLQETSNQTELQRKMFEVEHLIYNQWCSQYKSDTDS